MRSRARSTIVTGSPLSSRKTSPPLPRTAYARFGDVPVVVFALLLIGAVFLHGRTKKAH